MAQISSCKTRNHAQKPPRSKTAPVKHQPQKNDSAIHDFVKKSATTFLTKPKCLTYLLYMQTITSRDLVHRSKEIRKLLSAGQTLRWTSHGLPVALIQPASAQVPLAKPDWISRARAAGAVNSSHPSVADTVYQDRD
jgi:antitoxin (DNA-binding transcriptional repressor) of toxin-antitoxin stability system